MEDKVLEIMKEVFGVDDLDRSCTQKNCAELYSMCHLNLVVELESVFEISLEPEEIGSMRTFDEVCDIIRKKLA